MVKYKLKKKTEEQDLVIAIKEMREEESSPGFSKGSIKAFNSGYVDGMSEALNLLDEDVEKADHLKK